MTIQALLISTWNWNPWVLAPALAAGAVYGVWRGRNGGRSLWFFSGLALAVLALVSPLDALAKVLFSAHMVQHIVLLLVAPPLLLAGFAPREGEGKTGRRMGKILGRPGLTWLAGVGGMWLWHVPSLCDAAMAHPWLEALQNASLLLFGTMFWWPIVGPRLEQRLAPLAGVLYLFSACVGCTLLGIFITFAPVGLYPCFRNPMDPEGILPLARAWGLTPAADQQVGGLMMWVPACLVYVSGSLGLLSRWYGAPDVRAKALGEKGMVHRPARAEAGKHVR